jgi:hypothetical protein
LKPFFRDIDAWETASVEACVARSLVCAIFLSREKFRKIQMTSRKKNTRKQIITKKETSGLAEPLVSFIYSNFA